MIKKIWIYACGGYSDITAKAFNSYEEAYDAMKTDYEGMTDAVGDCEEWGNCSITEDRAAIITEDMGYEDPWGACITEQEIEV